jgi:hypothetical protein
MENPCRTCPRLNEPKTSDECMRCEKRFQYDDQIRSQPIGGDLLKPSKEFVMEKAAEPAAPGLPDPEANEKPKCKNGCDKKVFAKGLCWKCYDAQRDKPSGKKAEKPKPLPQKSPPEKSVQPDIVTIAIPTDLAARIEKIALKEYRDFHQQALWFLDTSCSVHESEANK